MKNTLILKSYYLSIRIQKKNHLMLTVINQVPFALFPFIVELEIKFLFNTFRILEINGGLGSSLALSPDYAPSGWP